MATKSSSSKKVTINVGGKSISLTAKQLASLPAATKAALNASIKSGKSTVSYGNTTLGSGGFSNKSTSTPDSSTPVNKNTSSTPASSTPASNIKKKVNLDTTINGGTTATGDLGIKDKIDVTKKKPDVPKIGIDMGLDIGLVNANGIKTNTQKDIITPTTPAKSVIPMAKGEIGRSVTPGIGGQKYIAPNGKVYDMSVDKATGQTSFTSKATGETRQFASAQEAINEINARNVGTNPSGFMKNGKTDSEVPAITQMTELADNLKNLGQKNADEYVQNIEPVIDQMSQYNSEVANNLSSIIQSRIGSMNSGFSALSSQISELESKANNLFDVQKMAAMRAREQGLAAQGILTSEQSAASGERVVQDYTNEVELKRSELMKSAAEMKVNAEKERLALNDQILQQQGIDEVTKQQMTQAVNQMYQNMYANYGTMVESANTAFANAMNTANQAKLGVDMISAQPMIEERVKATLSGIKKDKANSDAMYRYDYILEKLGEIDPNLRKYAGNIMAKDVAAGNFITQPIDMYISSLVGKIMPSYRADAKAGAV